MTVSIKIVPFSDTMNMYGQPDRSAAYSLSGHVVITLASPVSWFEQRRRAVRLLLQSLIVTFEGQSELITQETGYTACRICAISQELITEDAVELTNEGQLEDSEAAADGSCVWNVTFNLTVPGWLPASCVFGENSDKDTGTRYALYATAKFLEADSGVGTSWWAAACCVPFRSRTRRVCARKCAVQLNRYTIPHPSSSSSSSSDSGEPAATPTFDYVVFAKPPQTDADRASSSIPLDVLSKVCVVTSVPQQISVEDSSFSFCMRTRTKDLPESECKRLRITDFTIEVEQIERYRSLSASPYAARYPLPPAAEQPPTVPLRDPHPLQYLHELGFATAPHPRRACSRSFSLLPPEHSGHFALTGDGYAFRHDTEPDHRATWYSMRMDVPVLHEVPVRGAGADDKDKAGAQEENVSACPPAVLRGDVQSPLFAVEHRLSVALTCTYDLDEGFGGESPQRATERLQFHVPLYFGLPAPAPSAPVIASSPLCAMLASHSSSRQGHHSPSSSVDSVDSTTPLVAASSACPSSSECAPMPVPSLPYAQTLPAYSQLFDMYGNVKVDFSDPLPLYTLKPSEDALSLSHTESDSDLPLADA